jgi:hypothetical protein
MTLAAAVAAGAAVWCALPPRADRRFRSLLGAQHTGPTLDPVLAVTILLPLAAVVVLGPALGVVVAIVGTPAARRLVGGMESTASRRRTARLAEQLPTALDLMVAALDAGRPPGTAFALVAEVTPAPLGDELDLVGARLAVGGDPEAVWSHLGDDPVLRRSVAHSAGRRFQAFRSGAWWHPSATTCVASAEPCGASGAGASACALPRHWGRASCRRSSSSGSSPRSSASWEACPSASAEAGPSTATRRPVLVPNRRSSSSNASSRTPSSCITSTPRGHPMKPSRLRRERGMTTAEYTVGTLGACTVGGVLVKIGQSAWFGDLIKSLLEKIPGLVPGL